VEKRLQLFDLPPEVLPELIRKVRRLVKSCEKAGFLRVCRARSMRPDVEHEDHALADDDGIEWLGVAAATEIRDRLGCDGTGYDPGIRKHCGKGAQKIIGASVGTFNPSRGRNQQHRLTIPLPAKEATPYRRKLRLNQYVGP
jgi:hypothetical protein